MKKEKTLIDKFGRPLQNLDIVSYVKNDKMYIGVLEIEEINHSIVIPFEEQHTLNLYNYKNRVLDRADRMRVSENWYSSSCILILKRKAKLK